MPVEVNVSLSWYKNWRKDDLTWGITHGMKISQNLYRDISTKHVKEQVHAKRKQSSSNPPFLSCKLPAKFTKQLFQLYSCKHLEDEFLLVSSTGKWHHISGGASMALHRLVTHSSFSSPACCNGVNTPQPFKTKKSSSRNAWVFFKTKNYQENRSFERLGDYFLLNSTHYLVIQVIWFVSFWHTTKQQKTAFHKGFWD